MPGSALRVGGIGAAPDYGEVVSKSFLLAHRPDSDDYGNTNWIGYHTPLIGYGNIKLNEYYHDSNGGYTRYEEVFAHEMGHAFGLSHYDCDNELMQAKGYIYTPDPQEGDIAGYKAKYGL